MKRFPTKTNERFTYLTDDGELLSVALIRHEVTGDIIPDGWCDRKNTTLILSFLDYALMSQLRNEGQLIVDPSLIHAAKFCSITNSRN